MGTSTAIIQKAYEAFGRGDVPAILNPFADKADWEFVGPESLPYAGHRHNKQDVADFFAALPRADDIHAFEPREFIEAGPHATVPGWAGSNRPPWTRKRSSRASGFMSSRRAMKKLPAGGGCSTPLRDTEFCACDLSI